MSTEFQPKDRVSINKDLPYTTPRFGSTPEMETILTGTVTHSLNDNEVTVTLDYPESVPEGSRISYSYDPRDLTLISTSTDSTEFKQNDRVEIDKSLKYTKDRFCTTRDMRNIFTGTVSLVDKENNKARVRLDGTDYNFYYDLRDLTLVAIKKEKKGNTMSKLNKNDFKFDTNDRVSINKSLKHTRKRFGITDEMRSIFEGTIINVNEKTHTVIIILDGSVNRWTYDLRDLAPISDSFSTPTNVKTSNDKTTVEFSDGSTTSVKKSADDPYDLETAIAYCIAKKLVTNSCIKRLAKNAEEVIDKVNTEFYNKFLKPYGFLNESAYSDVEIETLKDYLKTLNDVRSDLALIAIENNLTKDELFNRLKG